MEETTAREGNTEYVRHVVASQIKHALSQDQELAKQVFAWLRLQGLKLTDY